MDADSDEVIIKRKTWDEAAHRDDVHMAESLILSGFLENVCYMITGCANRHWF